MRTNENGNSTELAVRPKSKSSPKVDSQVDLLLGADSVGRQLSRSTMAALRPKLWTLWLQQKLQFILNKLGYTVFRMPGTAEYDRASPIATYAPWNVDSAFLAAHKAIARNTLVDIYRCYELWTLVGQTAKLTGSLLEVGVWRGGSGP